LRVAQRRTRSATLAFEPLELPGIDVARGYEVATSVFRIQLSQGNAKAYPVAAGDVAADDDSSDRCVVEAWAVFQFCSKFFVNLDVRGVQVVECIGETSFGVRVHLLYQIAWAKQYEFSGVGFCRAHLNNKTMKIIASAQLKRAASCIGSLLELSL
jgi:hypothetical protein